MELEARESPEQIISEIRQHLSRMLDGQE